VRYLACGIFFVTRITPANSLQLPLPLLKVFDLALMVYITNYLLIPKLLYRKKYLLFAVLFVFFIIGASWLKMHIEGLLMNDPKTYDLFSDFKSNFYDKPSRIFYW